MTYNRETVHGTVQGYVYRGCRCEECRQAHRVYYGHRPWDEYIASLPEVRHGTESMYVRRGCRCDECRTAANAAKARRRANGIQVGIHNANGYANGCRCDVCREGWKLRRRGKRAREKATAQ